MRIFKGDASFVTAGEGFAITLTRKSLIKIVKEKFVFLIDAKSETLPKTGMWWLSIIWASKLHYILTKTTRDKPAFVAASKPSAWSCTGLPQYIWQKSWQKSTAII